MTLPLKFGITYHYQLPESDLKQARATFSEKADGKTLWTVEQELGFDALIEEDPLKTVVMLPEGSDQLTISTGYKPGKKPDDAVEVETVFTELGLKETLKKALVNFPWGNTTDAEISISLTEGERKSVFSTSSEPVEHRVQAEHDVVDSKRVVEHQTGILTNVNQIGSDGETDLIRAIKNNSVVQVQELFKYETLDVNAYNSDGETALREAVKLNNLNMVRLLLEHDDIDVNKGNMKHQSTPLLNAAANGRKSIVKLLLDRPEIDIHRENTNSPNKNTAYRFAKYRRHADVASLLDSYGANPDKIRLNPEKKLAKRFYEAVDNSDIQRAIAIINHPQFDPNYALSGRTCFYKACREGKTELARRMWVLKTPDVNTQKRLGFTPLVIAAEGGHMETVKFLLDDVGVNPYLKNKAGNSAAMLARKSGYLKIDQYIQEYIEKL